MIGRMNMRREVEIEWGNKKLSEKKKIEKKFFWVGKL